MDKIHQLHLTSLYENSEEAFFQAFNFAAIGMALVDLNGRWLEVNRSLCDIVGYTREELLKKTFQEMTHSDDLMSDLEQAEKLLEGKIPYYHMEKRYIHKSGRIVWILLSGTIFRDKNQKPLFFIAQIQDIDAKKKAELAVLQQRNLLESIFQYAGVGIILTDAQQQIIYANPKISYLLEYSLEELKQKKFHEFLLADDVVIYQNSLKQIEQGATHSANLEKLILKKSGTTLWGQLSLSFIPEIHDSSNQWIHVLTDITFTKQNEQRVIKQAHYDTLTGLPNRYYFMQQLRNFIKEAEDKKNDLALLFIDLNGFKNINDSEGHDVGDGILQEVSRRFSNIIRHTDFLARLGGDEFVILIKSFQSREKLLVLVERLLKSFDEPIESNGRSLILSCAIGIALYPEHTQNMEQLISYADCAMYEAKNELRNACFFFDSDLKKMKTQISDMSLEVEDAIVNKQFYFLYQPIINLETGYVEAFEVLLRWNHPKYGELLPEQFLQWISKTKYMIILEEWILMTIAEQLQKWQLKNVRKLLCVNISNALLSSSHFIEVLHTISKLINTEDLCFEINFAKLPSKKKIYVPCLQKIRDLGFKLTFDEFGSGAILFSLLQEVSFNYFKLDKEKVKWLDSSPSSKKAEIGSNDSNESNFIRMKEFVNSLIHLAKTFNVQAIAMAIETTRQEEVLKSLGCEFGQGYYYAKPCELKKVESFLFEKGVL